MDMQGVTLDTIGGGALSELFGAELDRILANIADPNTDPTAKRQVTITVAFKPNRDRDVANVELKQAHAEAVARRIDIFLSQHPELEERVIQVRP